MIYLLTTNIREKIHSFLMYMLVRSCSYAYCVHEQLQEEIVDETDEFVDVHKRYLMIE